ncbi:hypothetical protein BDR05DRAFT_1063392 [Suillus weaverae]|nr:hypothetical protein BDR05DRAFT_1063392 [Suillus weaverae]
MSGSLESRYILMRKKHQSLAVAHSRGVLSSEESAAWADSVTLSPQASAAFSVKIRASYEADRILGSVEVIGILELSWDDLLNHGDEPFDISFPPVRGVHPSLTLKVAVVHACDDALSDSLVDCEIALDTDAGHARLAKYVESLTCRLLCSIFSWFWTSVRSATSLFRKALALRLQPHPDHPLSLYSLTQVLTWRHNKKSTAADICEAAQLYHELLPLCLGGTSNALLQGRSSCTCPVLV